MPSMPALTATIINAGCLHERGVPNVATRSRGTRCQYAKINEGEGRVKSLALGCLDRLGSLIGKCAAPV